MIPQWSDAYKLNHTSIDHQHQELFRLANFLYKLNPRTTSKTEITVLFKSFYHYMNTHFKNEESYMESIGYPLLKNHQRLHEEIIGNINNILKTNKTIFELQMSMKEIVQKWLVEHILEHDFKITLWENGTLVSSDNKKI